MGIAGQSIADPPPNYIIVDVADYEQDCFNQPAADYTIAYGINESASQTVGQGENTCAPLDPFRGFRRKFYGDNSIVGLSPLTGLFSAAFAVTDGNRIVGWAHDDVFGVDIQRPCYWDPNGNELDLGTIGSGPTKEGVAYDMDESVRIVGQSETNTPDEFRATYWASATSGATDLGVLTGGSESVARGKNAKDDIVGMSRDASGKKVAILWESTGTNTWTMVSLPTLSGDSYAHDINDSKVICGWSVDATPERHAVKWEYNASIPAWEITDLETFSGGNKSEAFAINNDGFIVGQSRVSSSPGSERAFVYSDGTLKDLNCRYVNDDPSKDPVWVPHEARDINNNGDIAGWGHRDGLAKPRPFVLNPTVCEADLDGNGVVDTNDLLILLSDWGQTCSKSDLDKNSLVHTPDLLIFFANWSCGQATYEEFPESYADCFNRFMPDTEAVEACIEALIKAGG